MAIQQHILFTDFKVLPMREFDAIFGLDLILRHRVLTDFRKKKVHLHFETKGEDSILGLRPRHCFDDLLKSVGSETDDFGILFNIFCLFDHYEDLIFI